MLEDFELSRILEMGDEESEIIEIVKIPKGFIVRFANGELRLWVDDNEEVSFVKVGAIKL